MSQLPFSVLYLNGPLVTVVLLIPVQPASSSSSDSRAKVSWLLIPRNVWLKTPAGRRDNRRSRPVRRGKDRRTCDCGVAKGGRRTFSPRIVIKIDRCDQPRAGLSSQWRACNRVRVRPPLTIGRRHGIYQLMKSQLTSALALTRPEYRQRWFGGASCGHVMLANIGQPSPCGGVPPG